VIASGWFTELKLRKSEGWWAVTDSIDAIHGAMVQLLILTGQRRGEATGLEQAELD
jgi:hypothetical protein